MSQDLVMGIAVGTYETKGVLERGVEIGGHKILLEALMLPKRGTDPT